MRAFALKSVIIADFLPPRSEARAEPARPRRGSRPLRPRRASPSILPLLLTGAALLASCAKGKVIEEGDIQLVETNLRPTPVPQDAATPPDAAGGSSADDPDVPPPAMAGSGGAGGMTAPPTTDGDDSAGDGDDAGTPSDAGLDAG